MVLVTAKLAECLQQAGQVMTLDNEPRLSHALNLCTHQLNRFYAYAYF